MSTAIVWFRRDLRLTDNAALAYALEHAARVVPVYLHEPGEEGDWTPGAASRWWLHHSLTALTDTLAARGSRLLVRRGPILHTLRQLIHETGADLVCFNRLYEPAQLASDRSIENSLHADGVRVYAGTGHLLLEPWNIASQSGTPYRVYTPYARRLRESLTLPLPCPAPRVLPPVPAQLPSLALRELELLPTVRWDGGLAQRWQPGEAGAQRQLKRLARVVLPGYAQDRDVPAADGTTHLSPHLHFGEITPHQVWRAAQWANTGRVNNDGPAGTLRGVETLERELLWREFAHHILHHFPHTPDAPLDARYATFPWRRSKTLLDAWQRGETGIPMVDAGMRELWATGFMHNRVRMITASFLTKHLRLDWRHGARWFWDTLVDADLASNTFNWQWVAGCGADAAPWFRIFNPVLQSRKFDPQGTYLRRWLPELAALPDRYIHHPAEAPLPVLARAGIEIGKNYPQPVMDLAMGREQALAAFQGHQGSTCK